MGNQQKELTSNFHFLEGIQHCLSSPPCLNLIEYKRSKKKVTKFTFQYHFIACKTAFEPIISSHFPFLPYIKVLSSFFSLSSVGDAAFYNKLSGSFGDSWMIQNIEK